MERSNKVHNTPRIVSPQVLKMILRFHWIGSSLSLKVIANLLPECHAVPSPKCRHGISANTQQNIIHSILHECTDNSGTQEVSCYVLFDKKNKVTSCTPKANNAQCFFYSGNSKVSNQSLFQVLSFCIT